MIRRLVEQAYYSTTDPSIQAVDFWLAELRSPELLLEVAERYPEAAAKSPRKAVQAALGKDKEAIEESLEAEEKAERAADRVYWAPLVKGTQADPRGAPRSSLTARGGPRTQRIPVGHTWRLY